MRPKLTQAILAAFCAILCATSMGGGGMMLGLSRVAMAGGKKLPYDREVNYLQSSYSAGGPIINTLINSTGDVCSTEIKFQFDSSTSNCWLFGSYSGAIGNDYNYLLGSYSGLCFGLFGSKFYKTTLDQNVHVARINIDGKSTIDDNFLCNEVSTHSDPTVDMPFSTQILLFSSHKNKAAYMNHYSMPGKIFYCKIWKNYSLVRNFIPVVKDDVGYMYDRVSKELFGNVTGKGNFTWG